jgi:hypothetical protein
MKRFQLQNVLKEMQKITTRQTSICKLEEIKNDHIIYLLQEQLLSTARQIFNTKIYPLSLLYYNTLLNKLFKLQPYRYKKIKTQYV